MRVSRAQARLCRRGRSQVATLWIPAFAGMTGVESGNDGVEIENGGAESEKVSAH